MCISLSSNIFPNSIVDTFYSLRAHLLDNATVTSSELSSKLPPTPPQLAIVRAILNGHYDG